MNTNEEFLFYEDESNRLPDGHAHRRETARLTTHVPVRFSPEMIDAVRSLAQREQISVSGWIRRAVSRELERLAPPETMVGPTSLTFVCDPSIDEPQTSNPYLERTG